MSRNILRAGTRSLLIDLASLDEVMAWHVSLSAHPLQGQVEVIAAAKTILINLASRRDAQQAFEALSSFKPELQAASQNRQHVIDVIYDGEDLHSTAEILGISAEELITRHSEQKWLAAFGGFAPGFTYCVPSSSSGQDYTWDVPRRSTPRTAVPAGAVGLAGQFSAVYPRTSPGGWQLLGHTDTPMWDAQAEPPALLQPGDTLRYRAIRGSVDVCGSAASTPSNERCPDTSTDESAHDATQTDNGAPQSHSCAIDTKVFEVDNAGLQTLFQDSGRRGLGDMGVNHSGALDRASAWTANNILGNASTAVVVENIGGIALTASRDIAICVTGARATLSVDAQRHSLATPVLVRAGQQVTIDPESTPGSGLRSYLAVRGGFAVDKTLNSASTDILSGLGPRPVEAGDVLHASDTHGQAAVAQSSTNPLVTGQSLRVIAGPRDDWFAPGELERFCSTDWLVTGQSNRVGLRLSLPDSPPADVDDTSTSGPLQRANDKELESEGMVGGSIQVPPNGLPVVFLADHPVTGGYPVIATVIDADLDAAGQLAPGDTVRFTLVDPESLSPVSTAQHTAQKD